jgi:hypothetical protein
MPKCERGISDLYLGVLMIAVTHFDRLRVFRLPPKFFEPGISDRVSGAWRRLQVCLKS